MRHPLARARQVLPCLPRHPASREVARELVAHFVLTGFRYAMCAVTALGCVYLLNSLPERVHGMSEASKSLDDARSTMAALHWCPKTPGMCAARRSGPHFLSLRREGSGKRESILYQPPGILKKYKGVVPRRRTSPSHRGGQIASDTLLSPALPSARLCAAARSVTPRILPSTSTRVYEPGVSAHNAPTVRVRPPAPRAHGCHLVGTRRPLPAGLLHGVSRRSTQSIRHAASPAAHRAI